MTKVGQARWEWLVHHSREALKDKSQQSIRVWRSAMLAVIAANQEIKRLEAKLAKVK